MFMYLFFYVALSETIGVTYIYGNNDLPTYLTTFDVAVCIIVIFMANDFYVKKKSKELAVILMCGGTYLQLMGFLLFQTGILMALSIPAGILMGKLCFPLLGWVFHYMTGRSLQMASGKQPAVLSASITGAEVFWCTIVNLGYSYRNSIYTLLHGEEKIKMRAPQFLKTGGVKLLYPVLYLGCAVFLYICGGEPERVTVISAVGILGLCGSIDKVVLPWLEQGGQERWADQGEKLVYMGFFREDLKMAKGYIVLFISAADIMCSLAAGMIHQDAEFALCLLSFSSTIPLLGMSLMFRFAAEAAGRKKQLGTLLKIGFTSRQLKRIMRMELIWLYGFIMASSLLYIVSIVVVLSVHRLIPVMAGAALVLVFVVSLATCGGINYKYNSGSRDGSIG